jgi:hypothetical protein
MKIRIVGAELFQVDGRTDRYEETHSRFSQFAEKRLLKVMINNHTKFQWFLGHYNITPKQYR